jgi:hypothetical protein
MASSTLETIRTKVRRLTRSPSEAQVSTAQIDEYINTFIQYDFPEHLRLFQLRTNFVFYTKPYVDVYDTNTSDPADPLYQFKQLYPTFHEPIYIAGYRVLFSQSQEQFFGIYPKVNTIQQITSGDGVNTFFEGTLSAVTAPTLPATPGSGVPVLTNNVVFSSISTTNGALTLVDVPAEPFDGTGKLYVPNAFDVPESGTINYITGAFQFTFPVPPAAGAPIMSQTIPYQPTLPQSVLFYDDKFTFRPVPDQAYKVELEVYIRPTELLGADESPQLQQWWQYIAFGAARKVFQDRLDLESMALIEPEYKMQERLVLRSTIVQQTKERVATIYTESPQGYGPGWFSGGGNF